MKIGITGATGKLGRLVVEELKNKGLTSNIVALVRSTSKVNDLGVEAREFDYDKPENLAGALKGIDRLLLISGNEIGQRIRQHTNVIEAAKESGVKWIVYTSLLHADTSSINLAKEHLATEEVLKASTIKYTILRNGWYTENYVGSAAGSLAGGALIGSAGNGKISSAARVDFAVAAAVVLTDESHQGKTYELAGDEFYTLTDLAAEFSRQTGKNIPYKDLPESEYAKILKSLGFSEELASAFASWDTNVSKGDLFDDKHQLSKLIGRPTTSFTQAVSETLASLK
jgi:NAD(P)H dehydrogenase (quinone)